MNDRLNSVLRRPESKWLRFASKKGHFAYLREPWQPKNAGGCRPKAAEARHDMYSEAGWHEAGIDTVPKLGFLLQVLSFLEFSFLFLTFLKSNSSAEKGKIKQKIAGQSTKATLFIIATKSIVSYALTPVPSNLLASSRVKRTFASFD